jgi:hypothetical protein
MRGGFHISHSVYRLGMTISMLLSDPQALIRWHHLFYHLSAWFCASAFPSRNSPGLSVKTETSFKHSHRRDLYVFGEIYSYVQGIEVTRYALFLTFVPEQVVSLKAVGFPM